MKNRLIRFLFVLTCLGLSIGVRAASDVSVSTAVTSGGTYSGSVPNVFTPTADAAVANSATLQTSLNAGTSVTISTASAAAGAGDLTFSSAVTKSTGATAATLTLSAVRDLALNGVINTTTGSLPLVLSAGRGITSSAAITTRNGDVTINSVQTFVLGGALNAGTGQIFLQTGSLLSAAAPAAVQTVTASTVQAAAGTTWMHRGTIAGNFIVGGTLSAGTLASALQVNGSLTLQSTSTNIFDLAGTGKGTTYDSITATGAVTVAGALQLNFLNDFEHAIVTANTFTLISGASLTGTFTGLPNNTRITLPNDLGSVKILYTGTSVTLSDWQPVIRELTWDPGLADIGTQIVTQTSTRAGRHYFHLSAQATDIGAWRTRLTVATGEADLYLLSGAAFPQTIASFTHRSIRVGSDGLVLRNDQYTAGQDWYILVNSTAGSEWSLFTGRAWVQDLGSLAWTDTNGDGDYDIGEPTLPSGSGPVTVPAEGIRFFQTIVPVGTPAWSLWLNGDARDIAVRKNFVPFHNTAAQYDKKQARRMLVVPPYLTGTTSTYFLSVLGNPEDIIDLDSRIQQIQDIAFNSTQVDVEVSAAPYRVYRVQVPIQQIAWDVSVTPSVGDVNVCVRRDNAPAEFDNDAFSEIAGNVADSITLVPDFLTDATWFVTVYGNGPYTFTLRNGPPTITPLSFTDTKLNDQTLRVGWRFYALTDVPSQLGSLGWELNLLDQIPGTEIAIRRNAVPSRWNSRINGLPTVIIGGRVDAFGKGGFLQRPGHQADIWYVGVYTPTEALGAFTLTSAPILPATLSLDGGTEAFTAQEPGRWKFVKCTVPAGILGWDVRLTNIAGPKPDLVIRRDQLPQVIGTTGFTPSTSATWPSGAQWGGGIDWSAWTYDVGAPTNLAPGPRAVMAMGLPLEPGTYYVGVMNSSTTIAVSSTIDSRGIGTSQTYPLSGTLAYAGGSASIIDLLPREARYFKVTVPANTPTWEVTLAPSSGELLLVIRKEVIPDFSALEGGDAAITTGNRAIKMQKAGPERYVMLPQNGQDFIPAGDYYLAVVSEGLNPGSVANTIGGGACSAILTSVGPLIVNQLGTATAIGINQPIDLAGGQLKAYQFLVESGTESLEVRLDSKVGNPVMTLEFGSRLPLTPNLFESTLYGVDGGSTVPTPVTSNSILTVANPVPGTYTLIVRGGRITSPISFPAASANLVVIANSPIPLGFDGATSTIVAQSPGSWRYFEVTVPGSAMGWDIRLTNVTGPTPAMVIRRDQLPQTTTTTLANPSASFGWLSGAQWATQIDWTVKTYDIGAPSNIAPLPRLVMGRSHPLEPGTYFVGVLNNSTTLSTSYTIDSRGIGDGQTYPITTLALDGGALEITALPPREARYFKVTIPVFTPTWELTLDIGIGEQLLAVRGDTIPDFNAAETGIASINGGQVKMQKSGPERYVMIAPAGFEHIPPGDYYIAVVSEGVDPTSTVIGQGAINGTLTSVGQIPIIHIGDVTALGTTTPVSLAGGQIKAYDFVVPAGTASLEVRLDNRIGSPGMIFQSGSFLPSPGAVGGIYGYDGGSSKVDMVAGTSILTVANPPSGLFSLLVKAGRDAVSLLPDSSANLVIIANAPLPLILNGGTVSITDQSPGSWRYFQVTAPSNILGWDVRLTALSGVRPSMVVRRDQLPQLTTTTSGWVPSNSLSWPTGNQWATLLDWSAWTYDIGAPTNAAPLPRLFMATGRPLEAGTYIVGVYNNSTTTPISYTVDSRGVGTGQIYPVGNLDFIDGEATISAVAPREAKYFKVTIPDDTPSWEVTLAPTTGEFLLLVRRNVLPDFSALEGGDLLGATDRQIRMKKAGSERYVMLPAANEDLIPAGDYYLAVVGEGVNPGTVANTIGQGTSSGLMTSVGPLPVLQLGDAPVVGITEPVTLSGAQIRAYQFNVPEGTASLEVRLDGRVGNPLMVLQQGSRLPEPSSTLDGTALYGFDGGALATGKLSGESIITIANPSPGAFSLLVRAGRVLSAYPDASATLVIKQKPNIPLNFVAALNSGGGTHTDTRQIINGEYIIYEVNTTATLNGQPVLGWILNSEVFQGAATIQVYKDFANPTGGATISESYAVLVPPFFTPGDTWYVRVRGTGLTNYTITGLPLMHERPSWTMPSTHGVTFGDSGTTIGGDPLPGDQGVDLGQGQWHFYSIDVPEGNLGLLRTELQAISGNPDLYIRENGVPTTSHNSTGSGGSLLYQRKLTGLVTEYGNWVPVNGKLERQLTPGRWHIGVKAAGISNVRYRLLLSTGQVTDLNLNGGAASDQSIPDNDWQYFRFTVPVNAPASWALTFTQQVGDVVLWLRDTVPPGQMSENSTSTTMIASWSSDAKNQGLYSSTGHDAAGTYSFTTPPLRPGTTYYAGMRSKNSATFSISSATTGTIAAPPDLAFYGGSLVDVPVPANSSVSYKVTVPADARRWKHTGTATATLAWYLEEGTFVDFARVAAVAPHATSASSVSWNFNQILYGGVWPWFPGKIFYLTVRNTSATPQTFSFSMNGKNAETDDEDSDGLPDIWELANYGGSAFTAYIGTDDPDADGSTNLQEYQTGTEPRNPASVRYLLAASGIGATFSKSPDQPHYLPNTVVNVTAAPADGLTFIGWAPTAYDVATGYAAVVPEVNPLAVTMSANRAVSAFAGLPLAVALDAPGLTWTTGGAVLWYGQTTTSADLVDALRVSGSIPSTHDAWVQTSVSGPGLIAWKDKLAITPSGSRLATVVNGVQVANLTTTADWTARSTFVSTNGNNTVRWRFIRTSVAAAALNDAAFLDSVVFTPWAAPVLLAPTGISNTSATLNWAASTGATGYRVDIATNPTFSTGLQTFNLGATIFTRVVTGLIANTTYYYRVAALASGGLVATSSTGALVASTKTAQTITFTDPGAKVMGDPPFALSASATSGLPVAFTIVSGPATLSGNILTLTGPGTVLVRATQAGDATYAAAVAVERSLAVTGGSAYDAYLVAAGVPEGQRGFAADPDGDGVGNLLEYALGGNPASATSAPKGLSSLVSGQFRLTYTRARSDVSYTVETTTDLTASASWTASGVSQGTPDQNGLTTATVTVGGARVFLRLVVTLIP